MRVPQKRLSTICWEAKRGLLYPLLKWGHENGPIPQNPFWFFYFQHHEKNVFVFLYFFIIIVFILSYFPTVYLIYNEPMYRGDNSHIKIVINRIIF